MHHLLHHHVVTHVIAPLVISTIVAIAIASHDSRGKHPVVQQEAGKLPTHSKY